MKSLWCCVVFAFLFASHPVYAQLEVAVEGGQVVVREVTPGDSVAIVGVIQEFPGDMMHVRTPFRITEDVDRDGEVSLDATRLTRSSGVRAGFVAVELSSGRNAIGLSDQTRLNVDRDARIVMTDERDPKPYAVAIRGRMASALLVRPGVGAWRIIVQDGSSADGDGRGNRRILLLPGSFAHRSAESRPPTEFLDGDIVVAINTYTRAIHVVEIDSSKSMQGNEG